jgi:copper chaperone NosL
MWENTQMNANRLSQRSCLLGPTLLTFLLLGCGASKIEPVEIFPEDICAQCRMAVSEVRFASEIIDMHGDVYKFDDIGCMLKFRNKRSDLKINATFLKDYETREWIPYERAVIVRTSIETPMGSGKLAFADQERARAIQTRYPVSEEHADGCSHACCQ